MLAIPTPFRAGALSDNWVPVIEKDVDGTNSLPLRLDGEVPNLGKFVFWQPWLKGYNAEWAFPDNNLLLSRSWIDQELKAKLGH